ncbi:hypothetical protein JXJ21_03200, partial [candidate division KSB1 bacterium]|nr:hypothetical protein [candidate division KSB1 bacterium]
MVGQRSGFRQVDEENCEMIWNLSTTRNPIVVDIYSRHYSSTKNGKTIIDWLQYGISAPGESMTLLTRDRTAIYLWVNQLYRFDGQVGINC